MSIDNLFFITKNEKEIKELEKFISNLPKKTFVKEEDGPPLNLICFLKKYPLNAKEPTLIQVSLFPTQESKFNQIEIPEEAKKITYFNHDLKCISFGYKGVFYYIYDRFHSQQVEKFFK